MHCFHSRKLAQGRRRHNCCWAAGRAPGMQASRTFRMQRKMAAMTPMPPCPPAMGYQPRHQPRGTATVMPGGGSTTHQEPQQEDGGVGPLQKQTAPPFSVTCGVQAGESDTLREQGTAAAGNRLPVGAVCRCSRGVTPRVCAPARSRPVARSSHRSPRSSQCIS